MSRWRPTSSVAVLTLVATLLVACSSSTTASSGSPSKAGDQDGPALSSAPDPAYTGVNQPYFTTLEAPAVKSGFSFKVGFLTLNGGQPVLLAMQKAAQAEVEKLGGTFIAYDAGVDPQKQASQLNQLIAQKVDVIIGDPVVNAALVPGVAAAKAAGIPFIGIDGPADETKPLMANAVTAVTHSFDYMVWKTMKALAAAHPGARFATMGLAIPVDPLIYLVARMKYWGEEFGLEFLGDVDTQSDTPAGCELADGQ